MSNLGIKNSLVNEMARKFETIARSNSSDSSNSNTGLNYMSVPKRFSDNAIDEFEHLDRTNRAQIAFQPKKIHNFTVKHLDDKPNNLEFDSDEINFTFKSTDSKKQSTVKRKSGMEIFKNDVGSGSGKECDELRLEIGQLRAQLADINEELLNFKKKYQEFQLETETNEKMRNQQVDRLRHKVDYLLKASFSNTFSKSIDEDHDQSEQIIKF